MTKKVLTLKEIQEIGLKATYHHFMDKTFIKEWTEFVHNALTVGVSEFDIDGFNLSEEEFDEKYP